MADDQEDEASRLLKKILSPAEAQSLVLPPPTHAPVRYAKAWQDTLRHPHRQRLIAAEIRST
jgi:hypothetical protein